MVAKILAGKLKEESVFDSQKWKIYGCGYRGCPAREFSVALVTLASFDILFLFNEQPHIKAQSF